MHCTVMVFYRSARGALTTDGVAIFQPPAAPPPLIEMLPSVSRSERRSPGPAPGNSWPGLPGPGDRCWGKGRRPGLGAIHRGQVQDAGEGGQMLAQAKRARCRCMARSGRRLRRCSGLTPGQHISRGSGSRRRRKP